MGIKRLIGCKKVYKLKRKKSCQKIEKGDVDMATISFDRDIVLNKQASDKLLHILSEERNDKIEIEDINVEDKLARGKELLKHLFSR
ncbi:hypothetical protein EXQ31_09590 [Clostridium botulinum]|uniref:hypothetical protein n=1 Tax=Clostridium botulinum TaxID=1491 RepID=UPI00058630FD|nr:hypothetical protein [Clostridium botulinum]AJE13199.1 hypothetical protein T259_4211 [Clostridium botulinum CDC_1436]MBO0526660.1 hypothetical protein [Clostridium botulinum]MBO0528030.1 hypothetical protein [Clostridium botulinum]MBO0532518.1 hypothetical protein [Clostridium botulinum]MBO0534373.1 hypothetical protein [Clostridium botulinum]